MKNLITTRPSLDRRDLFQAGVAVWMMCAIFSAGSWNADMRVDDPASHQTVEQCRAELTTGFMIGIVGGPVSAIVSLMMMCITGNGISFSIDPAPLP